jgi:putative acetyltransferase
MRFKIKKALATSDEVKLLSDELYKELELMYGKGVIEDFVEENKEMLAFYVAYDDKGNAAACGALKHFNDTTAEIKRMYVKTDYRGRGLSKLILTQLEEYAKELKYNRLVLETGLKQPEAMSLYSKYGYKPLKCYGRHADDPDSRCFEKVINS